MGDLPGKDNEKGGVWHATCAHTHQKYPRQPFSSALPHIVPRASWTLKLCFPYPAYKYYLLLSRF